MSPSHGSSPSRSSSTVTPAAAAAVSSASLPQSAPPPSKKRTTRSLSWYSSARAKRQRTVSEQVEGSVLDSPASGLANLPAATSQEIVASGPVKDSVHAGGPVSDAPTAIPANLPAGAPQETAPSGPERDSMQVGSPDFSIPAAASADPPLVASLEIAGCGPDQGSVQASSDVPAAPSMDHPVKASQSSGDLVVRLTFPWSKRADFVTVLPRTPTSPVDPPVEAENKDEELAEPEKTVTAESEEEEDDGYDWDESRDGIFVKDKTGLDFHQRQVFYHFARTPGEKMRRLYEWHIPSEAPIWGIVRQEEWDAHYKALSQPQQPTRHQ